MKNSTSLPDLALDGGLRETLIEAAVVEAASLLQIVLGGGKHHPGPAISQPPTIRGMDPVAETLTLFNADWRGAVK